MKSCSWLDRFEKVTNLISGLLNWIACFAIAAVVLVTALDLLGVKVFRWTFAGAYEIIGILGLLIIVFAIPYTYVTGGHVRLEFFIIRLPERVRSVIATFISLCSLALFAILVWQMFDYGLFIQTAGAVTTIVHIPLAPFAYITSACALAMCSLLLVAMLRAVKGAKK